MDPITFPSVPRAGEAVHADNILAGARVFTALVAQRDADHRDPLFYEGGPCYRVALRVEEELARRGEEKLDPLYYEGEPVFRVALRVKAESGAYVHWLYAVRRSPSLYVLLDPELYVRFNGQGEVRSG